MYLGSLENGPFVHLKITHVSIENDVCIPQRYTPKELPKCSDFNKEFIILDT